MAPVSIPVNPVNPAADEPGAGSIPVDGTEPDIPAVVAPNLNVNIRILSPGDDGDVTQGGGLSIGGGAGAGLPDWTWNWKWTWSCAPAGTLGAAAWTWDWDWRWDCGPSAPTGSQATPHPPANHAVPQTLASAPALTDMESAPLRAPSAEGGSGGAGGEGDGRRGGGGEKRDGHRGGDRSGDSDPAVAVAPGGPTSATPSGLDPSTAAGSGLGTAAADASGGRSRPVPRRLPPPIAPTLPGMATAGTGSGGGGIASLLLAALLGGLVLLAPGRGARAPMRERNLHSSLSSERLERPG